MIVLAFFSWSSPIISGDWPSTKSNLNAVGVASISLIVNEQVYNTGFELAPASPHPTKYVSDTGCNVNSMPSASARSIAFSMPPVEVGAPSPKMGLKSDWSDSGFFTEKAIGLVRILVGCYLSQALVRHGLLVCFA